MADIHEAKRPPVSSDDEEADNEDNRNNDEEEAEEDTDTDGGGGGGMGSAASAPAVASASRVGRHSRNNSGTAGPGVPGGAAAAAVAAANLKPLSQLAHPHSTQPQSTQPGVLVDKAAQYRDYSLDATDGSIEKGEGAQNFPMKLHMILSNPEFQDIIAWLPHGRAWRILQHRAFEERVIPLYFRHGRYSSFARQVNGWSFRRITCGPDYNSYYHEMFLRGKPHLARKMKRVTSKEAKKLQEASQADADAPVPDFYAISRLYPLPELTGFRPPSAKDTSGAGGYDGSALGGPPGAMVVGSGNFRLDPNHKSQEEEIAALERRRQEILQRMTALQAGGQALPGNGTGNPAEDANAALLVLLGLQQQQQQQSQQQQQHQQAQQQQQQHQQQQQQQQQQIQQQALAMLAALTSGNPAAFLGGGNPPPMLQLGRTTGPPAPASGVAGGASNLPANLNLTQVLAQLQAVAPAAPPGAPLGASNNLSDLLAQTMQSQASAQPTAPPAAPPGQAMLANLSALAGMGATPSAAMTSAGGVTNSANTNHQALLQQLLLGGGAPQGAIPDLSAFLQPLSQQQQQQQHQPQAQQQQPPQQQQQLLGNASDNVASVNAPSPSDALAALQRQMAGGSNVPAPAPPPPAPAPALLSGNIPAGDNTAALQAVLLEATVAAGGSLTPELLSMLQRQLGTGFNDAAATTMPSPPIAPTPVPAAQSNPAPAPVPNNLLALLGVSNGTSLSAPMGATSGPAAAPSQDEWQRQLLAASAPNAVANPTAVLAELQRRLLGGNVPSDASVSSVPTSSNAPPAPSGPVTSAASTITGDLRQLLQAQLSGFTSNFLSGNPTSSNIGNEE